MNAIGAFKLRSACVSGAHSLLLLLLKCIQLKYGMTLDLDIPFSKLECCVNELAKLNHKRNEV